MDLTHVGGTAVEADGGYLRVSPVLHVLGGPTVCFEDGAGAAEALGVAFASSSGTAWIPIPDDTQAIGFYLLTSATAMTALEIQPWQSNDGGTQTVQLEADNSISGARLLMGPLYGRYEGQDGGNLTNGEYYFRLTRDQLSADATHIRLQARRVGGDATSALLAEVVFEG